MKRTYHGRDRSRLRRVPRPPCSRGRPGIAGVFEHGPSVRPPRLTGRPWGMLRPIAGGIALAVGLGMLITLAFFPQVEARMSEGPELTGEEPYVAVVDPRDGPDPAEPERGVLRIRVVTDVGILLIHDGGGTAENPGPPAEYADQWQELDDPYAPADSLEYPSAPPEYAGLWQDPDDATALESEDWADEPSAESEEWAGDPAAWEDEEWPAEPSAADSEERADESSALERGEWADDSAAFESDEWAAGSAAFEPEQWPADQDDVDAAAAPEAVDGTSGAYVALWHDFESHRLFVFERPIFEMLDVGHAVVNLERDLGIDAQSLAAEVAVVSEAIDAAWSQDEDATTWERASVEMIEYLLAFDPHGHPDRADPPPLRPWKSIECDGLMRLGALGWQVLFLGDLSNCVPTGGCTGPCCDDPDPCCGDPDPCCGSSDPCCGDPDPCCGSSDPCCGDPDPCCGSSDPCCGDPDPCCGSSDPCCGADPCDPVCGNPCLCLSCDDGNPCTVDTCDPDTGCSHEDMSCGSGNGSCCNPPADCCNGVCCAVGGSCCGSGCCDPGRECCEGETTCCAVGGSCCNDECCNGPCCQGNCCPAENSCCGSNCCAAGRECCEGETTCCAVGGSCCNDECCNGPCCQGNCCPAENSCCGSNCCVAGRECCEGETVCCAVGDVCCGDECCDEDRCCGNGECCAEECEECLDNGTLSGGTVTVVPQVVCIGQTITFTVDGVVDSGGLKRG